MARDFTQAKKEELSRALDLIDDGEWKPFMEWCGGRADEFGEWADRLGISSYTRRIDDYQNKVLEISSSTREQMDMVFENAAETDRRYAEIFRGYEEKVKEQIGIVEQMIKYFDSGNDTVLTARKEQKVTGIKNKGEIDNRYHKLLQNYVKMMTTPKRKFSPTQAITESDSNNDEFIYTIQMAYGFDEMTAQTMKKLYDELEKRYGDDAPQIFFALMASFSYGEVESTTNAILWGIIAHILPTKSYGYKIFEQYGVTEEEYERLKTQMSIQHILCEMPQNSSTEDLKRNGALNQYLNAGAEKALGVSFEELPEETKLLFYESYLAYCNRPDFTHMCATIATILYDGKEKELGNFAGIFNGIYSVDGNAGYVGDVYGTNGGGPSMGNADYMADLDAVNIANRIKNGKNVIEAISEYYVELENEQTNRAREFKYNIGEGDEGIGLYILLMESVDYYEYLEKMEISEDLEYRENLVERFIISLIKEYNYLYEE